MRPPRRRGTSSDSSPAAANRLLRRETALCLLLPVLLATSGCSRRIEVPDGLEGAADPTTQLGADGDACDLLTRPEVQLALNAPVGEFEEGGVPVLRGMQMCKAEAIAPSPSPPAGEETRSVASMTSESRAAWGFLRRSAEERFGAYERQEKNSTSMKVDGLAALWKEEGRTLTVLIDSDKAFSVQLTIENPPLPGKPDSQDRRAYTKRVAELLALRAIQRLE